MTHDYTLPVIRAIQNWGPKAYHALIIFAVGLAFAFFFRFLSRLAIARVGRGEDKIWGYLSSKQISSISRIISGLIFWVTVVLALLVSLEAFNINVTYRAFGNISLLIPKIFSSVLVLIIGILASHFVKNIFKAWAQKFSYRPLHNIANLAYLLCMVITFILVIRQLGFQVEFLTSFVLVILGSALMGIAISFGIGSAPIVSSLLAAFYMKKNACIGDYIKCEEIEGELRQMTKTSFILKKGASTYIVPARKMFSSIVEIRND